MSNFPRFGRARNRPSVVARPASAAGRLPAAELKPEVLPLVPVPATTQTVEPYLEPSTAVPAPASPLIESPRPFPSPVKKATSPKFEDWHSPLGVKPSPTPVKVKKATSPSASPKLEVLPSPPPVKVKRSPPVSPANKYSRRVPPPPLSPLALPRTQVTAVNGTTTQPRIEAEVEQKKVVYNKPVEKPAKSDRPSEYGSGKPPQRQQPEAINLTGHNVGAVMEINQSSAAGHRLGGETAKSNLTEGENEGKKKEKKKKSPMTTFMNSNFQSVNNSVMYDSSCNHRDPGLHIAFPNKDDAGDGAAVDDRKNHKP